MKPTLVSLFAGCGGSSLGYKAAGFDVRLAVEWDDEAVATYRDNFPHTPIYDGNIAALTGEEALRLASVDQELDVLDGSPPCQGFSTAGKRRMGDSRNRLFEEYVRLLEVFRPKAFIMENVSGLVKGKMRIIFAEMTAALKASGYRVCCRLLNAWWYGVPQDRRRLIWVGMREDLGLEPGHPEPTRRKPVSVTEALVRPDGIARGYGTAIKNAMHHNKWRSPGLPSPSLTAMMPPVVLVERHPGYRDAEFKGGPAPTLAAGRKTRIIDGSDRTAEARYLTTTEAKVLHGYPDEFRIDKYKLIGNSVPPSMAEAVGRKVLEILGAAGQSGG